MNMVLLKPPPSLLLLREAFHCLAEGVQRMNREGHPVTAELQTAYAVTSAAYAQQLRERIVSLPERPDFWPEIIDHVVKRLRQSTEEDVLLDPLDVLEQLAARLEAVEALVLSAGHRPPARAAYFQATS